MGDIGCMVLHGKADYEPTTPYIFVAHIKGGPKLRLHRLQVPIDVWHIQAEGGEVDGTAGSCCGHEWPAATGGVVVAEQIVAMGGRMEDTALGLQRQQRCQGKRRESSEAMCRQNSCSQRLPPRTCICGVARLEHTAHYAREIGATGMRPTCTWQYACGGLNPKP